MSELRRAPLAGFAMDPVGCYFAGPTFAHFCAEPSVWGVVLWGRPSSEDIAALVRSLALELDAPAVPHASIVDASRLQSVDPAAFAVLDGYVRARYDALADQVTRLALVRPEGVAGAVVAGFFEVLPRPYPVQIFASAALALEWLGASVTIAQALEAMHAEATGSPPVVTALRALLERNLVGMSVGGAALELGMSERTLQRRLQEASTSFADELNGARLSVAQRMLLDSDAPVTTIALEVGCATPQHFAALFRRFHGVSPSAWRREKRGPSKP